MDNSVQATRPHTARPQRLGALRTAVAKVRSRRAVQASRRAADLELARSEIAPLRFAWRVEELVSTKSRLDLAHSLRSLVRNASPRYVAPASPLNRLAVRADAETIGALASRLTDLGRPVTARGVVLLQRLLLDTSGPLYDLELEDDLPSYLDTALEALEPR
jgi:hypothetical protein